MKLIRVAIAEDNLLLRDQMKESLESAGDMKVVGCTENGSAVLALVSETAPDVLLCNMVMAGMDGYAILEQLDEARLAKKPRVIALSSLSRDDFVVHAMELGAQYYMVKPIDMKVLRRRVLEVGRLSLPMEEKAASVPTTALVQGPRPHGIARAADKVGITNRVTSVLLTLGMPPHLQGFQFMRDAVLLALEKPERLSALTKGLYPLIAQRCETSVLSVERSIRHAIEVTWSRGRIEAMDTIFGRRVCNLREKPTNGEFISLLTEVLAAGQELQSAR